MAQQLRVPLAALLVVVAGVSAAPQEPQKPIKYGEIFVDGGWAPDSMDELLKLSDIAVEGIVERAHALPNPPDGPVRTRFTIRVSELLKCDLPHFQNAQVLTLLMPGGDTDKGDYILRQEDANLRLLKLNQHVILFLRWYEHGKEFLLATATPDSIYLVEEGEGGEQLHTRGGGALARGFKGKPPEELRAKLHGPAGAAVGRPSVTPWTVEKDGSSGRTRTCNPPVNRLMRVGYLVGPEWVSFGLDRPVTWCSGLFTDCSLGSSGAPTAVSSWDPLSMR